MFKILFFLFSVFIIYKIIQFVSRVVSIYTNVKNQQFGKQNGGQNPNQKKKEGEVTIHFKENGKNKSHSTDNKHPDDEEYIDYEEVKE